MVRLEFLALVRCPVTGSPLAVAAAPLVASLNEAIEAGALTNRLGEVVADRIDAALVNADQTLAHAVRDEIVTLLADEAFPLDQLSTPASPTDA